MKSAFLILAAAIPLAAQVSYDRIRQADSEPGNWLTYSGGYNAQRYSRLDQINATNVRRLPAAGVYQIKARDAFETTPLVVDGLMSLSEPAGRGSALGTVSWRPVWRWTTT